MGSKNLNIAVIISSGLESGGGFQYEFMVLNLLQKYHNDDNVSLHYYAPSKKIAKDYSSLNLNIKILKENFFQKLYRLSLQNVFIQSLLTKLKINYSSIENKLFKDKIDLIYFLSPDLKSLGLTNTPFIFTLWDLGHLDIMEFPEVSYEGRFELREFIYSKSLKKAIKVIVDLDYGKQNVIKRYNLDERRVEVLRYLPSIRLSQSSQSIDIKKKYNLKNDFIFYPAQFWAHKNHIYILQGIKILKEKYNTNIDVVFAGGDAGNLEHVKKTSEELNLSKQVHFLGFINNEDLFNLYKQSIALVMPTFFGPTNIPPLEAFALGVPVLYSDLPGLKEQVGEAALLLNLDNPDSMATHLLSLLNDKNLRKNLIDLGKKRININNNYFEIVSLICSKFQIKMQTWK